MIGSKRMLRYVQARRRFSSAASPSPRSRWSGRHVPQCDGQHRVLRAQSRFQNAKPGRFKRRGLLRLSANAMTRGQVHGPKAGGRVTRAVDVDHDIPGLLRQRQHVAELASLDEIGPTRCIDVGLNEVRSLRPGQNRLDPSQIGPRVEVPMIPGGPQFPSIPGSEKPSRHADNRIASPSEIVR